MKVDLFYIEEVLWEDFKNNPRKLSKKDVDLNVNIPSYNTCLRRGLSLFKLNREFSARCYITNPKFCFYCRSILPVEKSNYKYCSSSCAAIVNGKLYPKRANALHNSGVVQSDSVFTKLNFCINCKNILDPRKGQSKYCSVMCQQSYQFELKFLDWYIFNKDFSNRILRKFLEVIHGYKCFVCGISSWNEKLLVLEVEHMDGNSENNHKDNICLICPNCHSQTDTYKGKNKGNGRHKRRQRYHDGKSY